MNTIWMLRGICAASLMIVALGVTYRFRLTPVPPPDPAEVAKVEEGRPAPESPKPDKSPTPAERTVGADPANPFPWLGSGDHNPEDDIAPDLKHPLTRSLGGVIDGNRELFDQIGADGLGQSLLEADEILWRTKQRNQAAMRQVNRQVRISGRAPHVILVTIEGLRLSGESDPSATTDTMPALHWIAEQGIVGRLPVGDVDAQRYALLTGKQSSSPQPMIAAPLSQAFWQSNYDTVAIGETSWWGTSNSASDWDSWLGFAKDKESEAFPQTVWSNGRQISLKANADGARKVAARRLFAQEALTYIERHHEGRPFILCLSLKVDPREALARGVKPAKARQIALGDIDGVLQEIDLQLGLLGISNRTLLAIVGLNSSADVDQAAEPGSSERSNLLVMRSPNRLAAGAQLPGMVRYEDLLPTLLDATSSHRRPAQLDGISRWQSFLRSRVETAVGSIR